MVASDTVVGVVGAVLLAVVMIGVFVYEYNNTPGADAGGGHGTTDAIAHFREHYPALNATADLDGDGKANYLDADLDQDGIDNLNDTAVAFTVPFSGSLQPGAASASADHAFKVQQGMAALQVDLFYNSTAPQPVPANPAIAFTVTGPEDAGSSVRPNPASGSTAYHASLAAERGLEPGDYTVHVTATGPSPSTPYVGRIIVSYGPGEGAHQH